MTVLNDGKEKERIELETFMSDGESFTGRMDGEREKVRRWMRIEEVIT